MGSLRGFEPRTRQFAVVNRMIELSSHRRDQMRPLPQYSGMLSHFVAMMENGALSDKNG